MRLLKLEDLVEDKDFARNFIDSEVGVMVNQHNDLITYLIVEYEESVEVYLELNDLGEPPYRELLAEGIAETVEEAKAIAVKNLNEMAYKNIN